MQRLQQIKERTNQDIAQWESILSSFGISGKVDNCYADIQYLLGALEQAQEKEKLAGLAISVSHDFLVKMNEQLNQSQERERVLREALEELTEIVQGVIDGDDYKFDSLTLQPARMALNPEDNWACLKLKQEGNQ